MKPRRDKSKFSGRAAALSKQDLPEPFENANVLGASFLDRLREVANLAQVVDKESGQRSLLFEQPLPLIRENQFSLAPDMAHGWKPDAESLAKIPSLSSFRSPQDRLADAAQEKRRRDRLEMKKKQREQELDTLMNNQKDELLSGDRPESATSPNKKQDQEKEVIQQPAPLSGPFMDNQEEEDEVDDETSVLQTDKNIVEPDPGPLTPRSIDSEPKVEQSNFQKSKTSFMEPPSQLTNYDDDDIIIQLRGNTQYKNVQIPKKDKHTPQPCRLPLLKNIFDPWVNQKYVENAEKYRCVYKRALFKDSRDLLYHNLRMKPDPLLATSQKPSGVDAQNESTDLKDIAIKTLTGFSLGTAKGLPQTHQMTAEKNDETGEEFLTFDSEYESGNLEAVFLDKSFAAGDNANADETAAGQRYVLLVGNDLNSKGHCQWFNFTVSGLNEDTEYEFQLGPFKKAKSKFQEGMLPWVCDLKVATEEGSRFPFRVNLARDVLSKVTYKSLREDKPGYNFLTLKVFIPRSSREYKSNRQLLIAYSEPYTYSRLDKLLNEMHGSAIIKKYKWLNFKIGKLCTSLGGTPLPLIKMTQKRNETVLSIYQRPVILITARVHPGEPPGSFLCEGLLRAILNPQNEKTVEKLLAVAEIHIVPMMNPDGVIIGNTRVNLGGVDMNRRWGDAVLEAEVTPEVFMLREYMKRYQNQILMYLDLHGHTKGEGIFFYACQPTLPKPNQDKSFSMAALEKMVWIKALPTLTSHQSTFYNLKHCRFFTELRDKQSNKMNTARVYCFKELGIDLSYTIESSFWGYKLIKGGKSNRIVFEENTFMKAGADLLSGIFNVTFATQKLQAMNKTILQFMQQKKSNLPNTGVVRQDAFLETLRPLLRNIYITVKQKFAAAMQLTIVKQMQETMVSNATKRRRLSRDISKELKITRIARFRDPDEARFNKVSLNKSLSPDDTRGSKVQTSRALIPILNKNLSENTLNSPDDETQFNPVEAFSSTLGAGSALLSPKKLLMQGSKLSFDASQTNGSKVVQANKTVSSLPSFTQMEPRLTPTLEIEGGDRRGRKGSTTLEDEGNIAESSDFDNDSLSGSDSNPSIDNLEDHMLGQLQSVINDHHQRQEKKKKNKDKGQKKKFLELLKNFDKLKESQADIRVSYDRAMIDDIRSKSQLAEMQMRNHDTSALHTLRNTSSNNQFIPTNSVISLGQKSNKRRNNRSSIKTLGNPSVTPRKQIKITDQLSSIYSKQFLPDQNVQLADQQSRMDAILQNRSRNFEASNKLTAPSIAMNMTGMNNTTRQHYNPMAQTRRKVQYSAIAQNQFSISSVFEKRSEQPVSVVPLRRDNQHLLPFINTQLKFFNEKRASSIDVVQENEQSEDDDRNPFLDFVDQSEHQLTAQQTARQTAQKWKVVPQTMLKTEKPVDKSVVSVPLPIQSMLNEKSLNRKPSQRISIAQKRHSSMTSVGQGGGHEQLLPQNPTQNPTQGATARKRFSDDRRAQSVLNHLKIKPVTQRPNNMGKVIMGGGSNLTPLKIIEKLTGDAKEQLVMSLRHTMIQSYNPPLANRSMVQQQQQQQQQQPRKKKRNASSNRRRVIKLKDDQLEQSKKPPNKVLTNISFQSFGQEQDTADNYAEYLQQSMINSRRNNVSIEAKQSHRHLTIDSLNPLANQTNGFDMMSNPPVEESASPYVKPHAAKRLINLQSGRPQQPGLVPLGSLLRSTLNNEHELPEISHLQTSLLLHATHNID